MVKKNTIMGKLLFIMAGIGVVLSFFLLTGADNGAPPVGRYQLQVVMRGNFPDLFVIDTSTGRIKWVDAKDENKPFKEIKSKY